LRITPIATHTKEDLGRALAAFEKVGKDLEII
jgi:7-keto-8-aminopelargonate synthetase-like enzyme